MSMVAEKILSQFTQSTMTQVLPQLLACQLTFKRTQVPKLVMDVAN